MRPFEIILIILIVLFLVGILAWQIVKRVRKKKGKAVKSSCGCCDGCAAKGGCPSAKKAPKDDTMPEVSVKSEVTCDFSDLTDNK